MSKDWAGKTGSTTPYTSFQVFNIVQLYKFSTRSALFKILSLIFAVLAFPAVVQAQYVPAEYWDEYNAACDNSENAAACEKLALGLENFETASDDLPRFHLMLAAAERSCGRGHLRICFLAGLWVRQYWYAIEEGTITEAEAKKLFVYTPFWGTASKYLEDACNMKKMDVNDPATYELQACYLFAEAQERDTTNEVRLQQARSMYSFLCLVSDTEDSCERACRMGVKPHCK